MGSFAWWLGRNVVLVTTLIDVLSCAPPTGEVEPSPLAVAPVPPALPLSAVRVPWDVPVESVFPEGSGLVRSLTHDEIRTVIEDRRAEDLTGTSADRFAAGGASYVLAILEPPLDRIVAELGLETHPVPLSWDARLFTPPVETREAEEGAEAAAPEGLGVAVAALSDPPPTGVPPQSCVSTPAPNAFCPYSTTASITRPAINCTQSLSQQILGAESTYVPITVGGVLRDYYRVQSLGATTGLSSKPVWSVRIGRAPDAAVPTVRQLVMVAGQHGNEWSPIEMVRRLIFYYASQYQSGNPTIRSLLDEQAILFVPAANPEGFQWTHDSSRQWRPNRQPCGGGAGIGIDVNRNYPFSWGVDDVGSSPTCGATDYRGSYAGEASEIGILRNAISASGYRTTTVIDIHEHAGTMMLPAGYSPGVPTSSSACTDPTNCTNPDIGLFFRLAGTERSAVLRHPDATSVPYVTDQLMRVLYTSNGSLVDDAMFGSPVGGSPNAIGMAIELSAPCANFDELSAPSTLNQQESDLRSLINRQLLYLPSLAAGTPNPFELPIFQRRNVAGPSAEPPTLRVSTRRGLTGVTITNAASIAGTTSIDDVRPGAFYDEFRWRPSGSAWVFPSRSFVCATGQACLIATLDAPTNVASINLCDQNRFLPGSLWTWTGSSGGAAACSWTFDAPAANGSAAWLTSTARDLTHMSQSRLVMSFRRKGNYQNTVAPVVRFDVEVSSNNFVGCSMSNFGACRVVRRVGNTVHASSPNAYYVTLVADVSDFDGQANVQMRVRVWDNENFSCGDGECRSPETTASCPVDCPVSPPPYSPRLRIFDPVFVGWYQ